MPFCGESVTLFFILPSALKFQRRPCAKFAKNCCTRNALKGTVWCVKDLVFYFRSRCPLCRCRHKACLEYLLMPSYHKFNGSNSRSFSSPKLNVSGQRRISSNILGGKLLKFPNQYVFYHFARIILTEKLKEKLENSRMGPFSPEFQGGTCPPCPPD